MKMYEKKLARERIVMPIVHDFIPLLSLVPALSRSTVLVVVVVVVNGGKGRRVTA